MKRREFIGLISGPLAWIATASAQEASRTYRIGFMMPLPRNAPPIVAFMDELRTHGFIEGQNLAIAFGGFQVRAEQIENLIPSLISSKPDVILSGGDLNTRAVQQ